MMYDYNGNVVNTAYGISETALERTYDAAGNLLTTPTKLKIMSYNVGEWYIGSNENVPVAKKYDYINLHKTQIQNANPDILLIQEYSNKLCVDGTTAEEAFLNDMFDTILTVGNNWTGHAICYNSKNVSVSNYASHNYTNARYDIYYPTWESFDVTMSGKTTTVINVHIPYKLDDLNAYCQEILNDILPNYTSFICCGDWNIDAVGHDVSEQRYQIAVKPFLDAGYKTCNLDAVNNVWYKTYFPSSAKSENDLIDDNCIVSSDIGILSVAVDETKMSTGFGDKIDHIPMIFNFQMVQP